MPMIIGSVLFFAPTLYISLDTSLGWTSTFRLDSGDLGELKSIGLFILTLLWPAL